MIGESIGRYRITEKLGEGGMGAVYGADDETLRRPVALKFLSAEMAADPRAREMPLKEARAVSRLNHPNIATVYEVDEVEGRPFIAMELVEGESLKEVLQRGALSSDRLLDIARQIADGLAEAHRQGVIHRDVKPGNVMIDDRGRVKILDFGLAVLARPAKGTEESMDHFLSRTATMYSTGGTVPYMSPEQLRGEEPDSRSDIFSFGALVYECLTGRLPFPGETSVDVLYAILRKPLTPVRVMVPDISPEWETLVESCLEKSPENRPPSMEGVLEALKRAAAPASRPEKSLAVLYFQNLSADEEDEYFRDGITEDIITELSKVEDLWVFSRSAVLAYREKRAAASQVGQELGASHVLEGSLRRAGKRIRINAQLVETRTGRSVWAERFDSQLEDIFAIQDEITESITRALQPMFTPDRERGGDRAQTPDVKAYDFYLKGRQYFHQFRRQGFDFARQMFARAIVVDPTYARAYAGVADCCSFLYMYYESSEENLEEADSASRKAIELDPDSAEAHASRGLAVSLSKRYEEAAEQFERAIELNPKLFEAHYFYARARFAQGELEEAARLFEQASRVNPEDYQAPHLLGQVYWGLDRQEEAEEASRRALQIMQRHVELHPDDARALYLGGAAFAHLGDTERGRQWAERALQIDPDDSSVLYNVACTYAIVGEVERALDCLEGSITSGMGQKEWMEHDTDLDPLRAHRRFAELLTRLDRSED